MPNVEIRENQPCIEVPLSFDGKESEGLGRDHINYHPVMVGKMMGAPNIYP